MISVRDTGIGIEATLLPRVFEAYTQAHGTLARSRGGLGLGLALVKGVVDLHGGSVAAVSDGPGTGTEVTVELPLSEPASAGLRGNPSVGTSAIRSRRILIIEDNPDSADSLKLYLELHGHAVLTARSGPEGIKLAGESPPEVVICDVGLPGMDGYAVAGELRRLVAPSPILIIAVSGHGPRKGAENEPDKLFDYYLLKPAEPDRVCRLISAEFLPS